VGRQAVLRHRDLMEEIVSRHLPAPLAGTAWKQLIEDMMDALAFAVAGLRGVVRGKRARPDAWALDILHRDVSDALARVAVSSTMHPDHSLSRTQSLVKEIAERFGLPGHDERGVGNLFKQAQRGRWIEKTKHPDVLIEHTPATGEVEVTIGDPAAPLVKKRRQFDTAT
jgi:hypothetical protein